MRNILQAAALAAAATAGWTAAASAEVPRVATDIAPVHGLVARVMQGLGEPEIVVAPGASPHGYSMRPSEALALERADAVFWVGEALTPWLEGALNELAADACVVELLETEGTRRLEFREGATFEAHGHGDEHGAHEDDHGDDHADEHADAGHGHDDHGEDGHEDQAAHDGHADHDDHDDHSGGHAHHHEGTDPHAWLSPENGKRWLEVIARALSGIDPGNAAAYAANAEAGKAEIDAAVAQIDSGLEAFRSRRFIVFHDAYQYFEASFGLSAAGAISIGDASDPSPARIAEIQNAVSDLDVSCVFTEPQFNPGLAAVVLEGTGAATVVIDPLGTGLETGPGFYPALLSELGAAMASCG